MTYHLNICHLYPDLMDTYGDKGNIITIVKRCQWRGIKTDIINISVGNSLSTSDFDFFFFGGGQDRQQIIVGRDLASKEKDLKNAIERNVVLLAICGGYQLLQEYFKTLEGKIIKGIGLFDAYTIGSTTRMIGNLLIDIDENLQKEINVILGSPSMSLRLNSATHESNLNTDSGRALRLYSGQLKGSESYRTARMTKDLVGFENHSGKTYLGKNLKPLGAVIKGSGNNGEDGTEGAVYKNAFGCYLHGSLLPKNPHFADYLISKSLERRYGRVQLKPLDDSIEWQAHEAAIKRTRSTR